MHIIHALFIDFEQVHERVNRNELYKATREISMPE